MPHGRPCSPSSTIAMRCLAARSFPLIVGSCRALIGVQMYILIIRIELVVVVVAGTRRRALCRHPRYVQAGVPLSRLRESA